MPPTFPLRATYFSTRVSLFRVAVLHALWKYLLLVENSRGRLELVAVGLHLVPEQGLDLDFFAVFCDEVVPTGAADPVLAQHGVGQCAHGVLDWKRRQDPDPAPALVSEECRSWQILQRSCVVLSLLVVVKKVNMKKVKVKQNEVVYI
jgi:hypothetical protein